MNTCFVCEKPTDFIEEKEQLLCSIECYEKYKKMDTCHRCGDKSNLIDISLAGFCSYYCQYMQEIYDSEYRDLHQFDTVQDD